MFGGDEFFDDGTTGYGTRKNRRGVPRNLGPDVTDPQEETQSGQPIPVFMSKVYQIVDDPATDDMVHWSDDGTGFVVTNAVGFAREILPQYFRHSNFSSFVRQLNFYGFRSASRRVPECRKRRLWEFSHPRFQRGDKDSLADIRRKTYSEGAVATANKMDVEELRKDVDDLRKGLLEVRATLSQLLRSAVAAVHEIALKESQRQAATEWADLLPDDLELPALGPGGV